MAAPRDGGCGAVSLLFTPSTKVADGQRSGTPGDFRTLSGLTRTPASAGRAFASGTAAAAGPTPSSRRRSLTPASSRQMDSPPPPPMDSLLDLPGGNGSSKAPWGTLQPGTEEENGRALDYASGAASAMAVGSTALKLDSSDNTWVTVFGFNQADLPLVIHEFSRAGDVEQFGTFGEPTNCNWVHIQYKTNHAAQRALLRDGDRLSANCMIGVKALGEEHCAAMEDHRERRSSSNSSKVALGFPKLQQERAYALGSKAVANAGLPLPSKGLPQRLYEFVMGL